MGFLSRVKNRLLLEAQWRCLEPVVVIESDDWGLERKPCADLLARYGEPTDWAAEATETGEDLNALFHLLRNHRDPLGRPACVTANFVMSNPNYEAIAASGFAEYSYAPLDQTCPPERKAAYEDGMTDGCFIPQYHGLRHLHPDPFLRDLRSGEPAPRELFGIGAAGGLGMLKGQLWRYHSEYEDVGRRLPDSAATIRATVETGVGIFERFFGFRPESTISPHYLISGAILDAWGKAGFRYVQGGNYQMWTGSRGKPSVRSSRLGASAAQGLTFLSRNVKLEDRPQRKETVSRALQEAMWCIQAKVPVIVDSHRINYTGMFRERGLNALQRFLEGVAPMKPLFLTSAELGSAVLNRGAFLDERTGQPRSLTPAGTVWTTLAQTAVDLL